MDLRQKAERVCLLILAPLAFARTFFSHIFNLCVLPSIFNYKCFNGSFHVISYFIIIKKKK